MKPSRPVFSRAVFSTILGFGSRLSFASTIVLIPFRLRLVLLARPQPPLFGDYTNFLLFAADISVLCTLILWLASLLFSPRKLVLGPRHLWVPLAALTLAGWASAVSSDDPMLSAYHALRLLGLFWFYVFIVNEIRSPAWLVLPVAAQVSFQSVVAIAQFMAQRSVDLQSVGELQLDPAWRGISIVVENGVRLLRAYGLADHPNILGGALAVGLVVLLAAHLNGSAQPVLLAAIIPAVPALLVTFSRSAWLAFALGAALLVGVELAQRRWNALSPLAPLALACTILTLSFLLAYARFFGVRLNAGNSFNSPSVEQQSIGERMLLINSAAPLLFERPLFGVGLGASPRALQRHYPTFPVDYEPPHLTPLDSALETGVFGAASYLALMLAPFIVYVRSRRLLLANPFATAALAVLISLSVIGLLDYYTWLLVPGRLMQWVAWGAWAVAISPSRSPGAPFPGRGPL